MIAATVAATAMLTGCGGGGGGSTGNQEPVPAPGSTIDTALEITSGEALTGTISSIDEVDYFGVTIEGPGTLTIGITDEDLDISILDPDGVEIPSRSGSVIAEITEEIYESLKEKAKDTGVVKAFVAVRAKTREAVGKIYRGAVSYLPQDEMPPEPVDPEPPRHANFRELTDIRGLIDVGQFTSSSDAVGTGAGEIVIVAGGNLRGPVTQKAPRAYRNVAHGLRHGSEAFAPETQTVEGVTATTQETIHAYWGNWAAAELVVYQTNFDGGTINSPAGEFDLAAGHGVGAIAQAYGGFASGPDGTRAGPPSGRASYSYEGFAAVFDTAHGIRNGVPVTMRYTPQGELLPTPDDRARPEASRNTLDINIAYDSGIGCCRYIVQASGRVGFYGDDRFRQENSSGYVDASFYSEDEVAGTFHRYVNKRVLVPEAPSLGYTADRAIVGSFVARDE